MAKSMAMKCMSRFCRAVVSVFGPEYMRTLNEEDTTHLVPECSARISWNAWEHIEMEELPVYLAGYMHKGHKGGLWY
jgi:hypothetical protein